MKEIQATEIGENLVKLISKDWMLVTAGSENNFNTMTANWGFIGELWFKDMVEVFIRQERFTKEFVDREGRFTLCFFPEEYKKNLSVLGTKSGRDMDKIHNSGLTPITLESGQIAFEEAKLIIECKIVYSDILDEGKFLDHSIFDQCYANPKIPGGIHTRYYAEIEKVFSK